MAKDDLLTEEEAYLAMYAYLKGLYDLTKSDYLGMLLGSMSYLSDGRTADPAVMHEWNAAIAKVRRGKVDAALLLTEVEKEQ